MNYEVYDLELCQLWIYEEDDEICGVSFSQISDFKNANNHETPIIIEAKNQLKKYFLGKLKEFNLPLKFFGTDFQKKVWQSLCLIPYGETLSYKDIAKKFNNEKACRAVGMANNKNKIAIIVPCHRVIGASGKLTGYAGGLELKEQLLKLERKN